MPMPLVALPAPQTVGGRPRKEGVYDTEVYPDNVVTRQNLDLFARFDAFAVAPVNAFTKQRGRDTNQTGGQGLPTNTHLFWYEWRLKLRPLGVDIGAAASINMTADIHRLLWLMAVRFNFAQTTLIELQADELPTGTGPQTTFSTITNRTVFSVPNQVPNRKGKIVTVTGKPTSIDALQEFRVALAIPEGAFTPQDDMFVTAYLEGLLLRGVTG